MTASVFQKSLFHIFFFIDHPQYDLEVSMIESGMLDEARHLKFAVVGARTGMGTKHWSK